MNQEEDDALDWSAGAVGVDRMCAGYGNRIQPGYGGMLCAMFSGTSMQLHHRTV